MNSNKTAFLSMVATATGLALGLLTPPLLILAIYALGSGLLLWVLARNWVPFDVLRLSPLPPPPPRVLDNTVATEDGSQLASTPLARACALLMGLAAAAVILRQVPAPTLPAGMAWGLGLALATGLLAGLGLGVRYAAALRVRLACLSDSPSP